MNRLTPRQIQSLELSSQGMVSSQIARHMGITNRTVLTHRQNALRTLGAATTPHAVAMLISRGIIGRCSVAAGEAESIVVTGAA